MLNDQRIYWRHRAVMTLNSVYSILWVPYKSEQRKSNARKNTTAWIPLCFSPSQKNTCTLTHWLLSNFNLITRRKICRWGDHCSQVKQRGSELAEFLSFSEEILFQFLSPPPFYCQQPLSSPCLDTFQCFSLCPPECDQRPCCIPFVGRSHCSFLLLLTAMSRDASAELGTQQESWGERRGPTIIKKRWKIMHGLDTTTVFPLVSLYLFLNLNNTVTR